MNLLPGALLDLYRYGTAPLRLLTQAQLRRHQATPVTGLFLHRVADDYPNPWTMSCATFDRLLTWLQKHCDLVSMEEAQYRLEEGYAGRLTVHLSFDDGYADNCLHALPLLLRRKIPFTYFITTHNIRHAKPFPHDLKRGCPLAPNSVEEIKALADAGVEIGVHTRTHPDLGKVHSFREIEVEVGGARHDIAEWTGQQATRFAFPFGLQHNLNSRVIQYLADEGFSGYCSAYGGYNRSGDTPFHLRRFHADPCLARVRNWLTLDPRWWLAAPEYEYVPFTRASASQSAESTVELDPS